MEIKDWPNYLIYPDGRVWTKKRKRVKEGFLKPSINKSGYSHVILCHNRKQKTYRLHRLVAEHYIPNPDNKPEVDHINRDKTDNRVENLRWVLRSENQKNRSIIINKEIPYLWIKKNGNSFAFRRKYCNDKYSKSIPKLLCYSFFYLLKYPYH
jgi:hypothetical protein